MSDDRLCSCACRAAIINGAVKKGDSVLITGIGGGVALIALQLCVAQGANVYVTSGGADKIRKAVELGAKGGVSYKDSMLRPILRSQQ